MMQKWAVPTRVIENSQIVSAFFSINSRAIFLINTACTNPARTRTSLGPSPSYTQNKIAHKQWKPVCKAIIDECYICSWFLTK